MLRDRAIEHPADDGTVEIRRRDPKADDAAGVKSPHRQLAFNPGLQSSTKIFSLAICDELK